MVERRVSTEDGTSMRVEERGPKITAEQVSAFESELGGELPRDYLDFLLTNNGGYPVPDVFSFEDGRPGSSVHYFFQLRGGDRTSRLSYALETYRARIPAGLLPVARDPGGNLICVGFISGPYDSRVVFWDHEREADVGEDATTENLTPIAASFAEFLSGLHG